MFCRIRCSSFVLVPARPLARAGSKRQSLLHRMRRPHSAVVVTVQHVFSCPLELLVSAHWGTFFFLPCFKSNYGQPTPACICLVSDGLRQSNKSNEASPADGDTGHCTALQSRLVHGRCLFILPVHLTSGILEDEMHASATCKRTTIQLRRFRSSEAYGHALAHSLLRLAMQQLRAVPSEIMIWCIFPAICTKPSSHAYSSWTESTNAYGSEAIPHISYYSLPVPLQPRGLSPFSGWVYASP